MIIVELRCFPSRITDQVFAPSLDAARAQLLLSGQLMVDKEGYYRDVNGLLITLTCCEQGSEAWWAEYKHPNFKTEAERILEHRARRIMARHYGS